MSWDGNKSWFTMVMSMLLFGGVFYVAGCKHDLDLPRPSDAARDVDASQDTGADKDPATGDTVKADLPGGDTAQPDLPGADVGKADLSKADVGKADLSKADAAKADLSKADAAKADLSKADAAKADLSKADAVKLDLPVVDSQTPKTDAQQTDTLKLDLLAPDQTPAKALVDDTFADFSQGSLMDFGAKIYVSAKGNVQMLDRLDIDQDGYLDVVICNAYDGNNNPQVNSYIYWGSGLGGFKSTARELPTQGGFGAAVADLNDDSYPDVVFANHKSKTSTSTSSYIYWGAKGGLSKYNRSDLPTVGAGGVAVADLNADGYLDLVFSNQWTGNVWALNSYIYWGAKGGFSKTKRTELPTSGAYDPSIADLNGDGHLDIVFPSFRKGKLHELNSLIYWGTTYGFSASNHTPLPTSAATGSAVADLNKDGRLDIVFPSYRNDSASSNIQNSYIYWGALGGYTTKDRTVLTTGRAHGISVADLNNDKHLDIVISNRYDLFGSTYDNTINSYIYWGSGTKTYTTGNRTGLPTNGAVGSLVADFDSNGHPDLVFFNSGDAVSGVIAKTNSYVYRGKAFNVASRVVLPGLRATQSTTIDPGAVSDRRPVQVFTSRVLDTGATSPTYLSLYWKASVPKKTQLKFQLRSGSTTAALAKAPWRGPMSTVDFYKTTPAKINTVHDGSRYIQYRATFESDLGNTPVLDRVQVTYK